MSQPLPTTDPQSSPPTENVGIDQTEDEFKPSKVSRLIQLVTDVVKKNYNVDPTGEEYVVAVVTSMDKGQSYRLVADSTEDQRYTFDSNKNEVWAKQMIEKEMMDMKMNENEIITMAKQKLKDEQAREAAELAKNS